MKWVKRILIILLLILILVTSIILLNGYHLYQSVLSETSLSDKIKEIKEDEDYVSLSDVPDYYKNAIIAVEDHRYYDHGPIDIIAIGRALVTNISHFELREGGSTITQQVAKNIIFSQEQTLSRKLGEIFAAFDLEKNYSKDEILELYVNTIYFGDGYYGIEEACKGYLNKDVSEMSLEDCTMLAGIPNAPSVYAPTVNPKLTRSRQEKVIASMFEYGYLSETDKDGSLNKLDEYYSQFDKR